MIIGLFFALSSLLFDALFILVFIVNIMFMLCLFLLGFDQAVGSITVKVIND